MRIGIIGPSKEEIYPFIESMDIQKISHFAMLTFHEGLYKDLDVVALYCGVCKVNAAIAAQVLVDKFEVTHIIVVGVAGGIDARLKIGDTVISTEVAYHDVDKGILTEYHPWMHDVYFKADANLLRICSKFENVVLGRVVTGEAFITDDGRQEIIDKYTPLCVDMETGAIAHACYVNNIPFIAIRSITDTLEDSGIEVFEENCVDASNVSINVLKQLLNRIKSELVQKRTL